MIADTLLPGQQCSSWRPQCADIQDHMECWLGVTYQYAGCSRTFDRADGYCPYTIGMLQSTRSLKKR